jgi:protein-S-isoprenylcysteine O-methyltransferase Ste14
MQGWSLTIVPLVFTSPVDGVLYLAVYAAWFVAFFGERAIIHRGVPRETRRRSDRGSGLLIFLSVFVAIFIADAFARRGFALLPPVSFYLGLVMMVAGMLVRLWAVSTLRGFFSYTVQIKEGHHVVVDGPYRFVRHPAYTGSLLTILGIGFALQSWGAVLVMALVFGITFGYRIRVEEKLLSTSLGEEYLSYSRRVKRLIPYVY